MDVLVSSLQEKCQPMPVLSLEYRQHCWAPMSAHWQLQIASSEPWFQWEQLHSYQAIINITRAQAQGARGQLPVLFLHFQMAGLSGRGSVKSADMKWAANILVLRETDKAHSTGSSLFNLDLSFAIVASEATQHSGASKKGLCYLGLLLGKSHYWVVWVAKQSVI